MGFRIGVKWFGRRSYLAHSMGQVELQLKAISVIPVCGLVEWAIPSFDGGEGA